MRWWLRPKWVVGHLLCFTLVVLFVNLGFWQLRRLDERRERNDLIERRMEGVSSLEDVLGTDLAYRRVLVAGRWLAEETVLVRSRALEGRPGYHVVTPLQTAADVLFVNRGFVPRAGGDERQLLADMTPPGDETVRIEGLLRPTEQRGRFGPTDADGDTRVVNRVDVPRLATRVDGDVVPGVFLQQTAPPPANGFPELLPLPETGDGPHLSYAVQWFIFATVGAVGWPLLLRRTARDVRDDPSHTEPHPHAA